LLAVTVNGDFVALKRLHDEIGDYPAVVWMRARALGVEDAPDLDAQAMLAITVEKQCFGTALVLVIARAQTDRIHMAPIVRGLGMDGGSPGYHLIDVNKRRKCHVVAHELETLVIEQMFDIALLTREEIIDAQHLCAARDQPIAQYLLTATR